MKEVGIDISSHTSNNIQEYRELDFDYFFTVNDHALEPCPVFSTQAQRFHYNFSGPVKATGTQDTIMKEFRKLRTVIKNYSFDFVRKNFSVGGQNVNN